MQSFNIGYRIRLLLIIICFSLSLICCKKLVDVTPPATNVSGVSVYSSDATAAAVLTGLYIQISNTAYHSLGLPTISLLAGLSADELTLWNGVTDNKLIAYYTNALSSAAPAEAGTELWYKIYPYIFTCNSAIEGLAEARSLTSNVKSQLLGEAKFMRAFLYFYLINLYGDVPLVSGTDYSANVKLPRAPMAEVYQQLIADLIDAQNLLSSNYLKADLLGTTSERVRPTKWAAAALLARVYLYTMDWENAELKSTEVINNSSLYKLSDLDDVFLKNSTEAIWQLQPVTTGITNTQDAALFIIPSTGPNDATPGNPVFLSDNLLGRFESGDKRKSNWIDSITVGSETYFFPYKYRINDFDAPVTEYLMVFRLGELFLVRAEARAHLNNLKGSQSDINVIRMRAGLANTTGDNKDSLLKAIYQERQIELFTEWGHRWLDLKRTNMVDLVMNKVAPQKGGIWNPHWKLYPLPLSDIEKNNNIKQNDSY